MSADKFKHDISNLMKIKQAIYEILNISKKFHMLSYFQYSLYYTNKILATPYIFCHVDFHYEG
jgi:hypothetical protein